MNEVSLEQLRTLLKEFKIGEKIYLPFSKELTRKDRADLKKNLKTLKCVVRIRRMKNTRKDDPFFRYRLTRTS